MERDVDANYSLEEERKRFWERVAVGEPGECWLFLRKDGTPYQTYGEYYSPTFGHIRATHMVMLLQMEFVPRTRGVTHVVMHHCDNKPCCNPAHLKIATQGENMRDKWAKGLQSPKNDRRRIVERLQARNSPRLATLGPEWFS